MARIQVVVRDEVMRQIEALAAEYELTHSDVIRAVLSAGLYGGSLERLLSSAVRTSPAPHFEPVES